MNIQLAENFAAHLRHATLATPPFISLDQPLWCSMNNQPGCIVATKLSVQKVVSMALRIVNYLQTVGHLKSINKHYYGNMLTISKSEGQTLIGLITFGMSNAFQPQCMYIEQFYLSESGILDQIQLEDPRSKYMPQISVLFSLSIITAQGEMKFPICPVYMKFY